MIFLRSHGALKIKQLRGNAVETPPGVTGVLVTDCYVLGAQKNRLIETVFLVTTTYVVDEK